MPCDKWTLYKGVLPPVEWSILSLPLDWFSQRPLRFLSYLRNKLPLSLSHFLAYKDNPSILSRRFSPAWGVNEMHTIDSSSSLMLIKTPCVFAHTTDRTLAHTTRVRFLLFSCRLRQVFLISFPFVWICHFPCAVSSWGSRPIFISLCWTFILPQRSTRPWH